VRTWTVDAPVAGEVATPNEYMAELSDLVANYHSIDGSNLAYQRVTAAKLTAPAIRSMTRSIKATPQTITHQARPNQGVSFPIPDNTGAPWVVPVTTNDGVVEITLGACWADNLTSLPLRVWIGIQWDGNLIARSPIQPLAPFTWHAMVKALVPVGARTYRLEPVYGMHESITGAPRQVTWLERVVTALEGDR
jgi:hypothetical protein